MKVQVEILGKVAMTIDKNPWTPGKPYDILVVAYNEDDGISYISRKPVPPAYVSSSDKAGQLIPQSDREYWIPLGKASTTVSFGTFTLLENINLLPDSEDNDSPYLIDGVAYYWVETGGDTLDGKYQSVAIEGKQGKSAYQIWQERTGDTTTTEDEWLEGYVKGKDGRNGLPGVDGRNGRDGIAGKSAFQIWQTYNATSSIDEATWLEEYVHGTDGDDGESSYQIWKRLNPYSSWTESQWLENYVKGRNGAAGPKGDDGDSAYEVAMQQREFDGLPRITVDEWIETITGPTGPVGPPGLNGANGRDGKSAFVIANEVRIANNQRVYASPAEWMADLKGDQGEAETIRSMSVINGELVVVTQVGDDDDSPNTYNIVLPTIPVPTPGGGNVNPDVPLRKGTLEAAKSYAEQYPDSYFQWLLEETVTDGEPPLTTEVTILKPIWHCKNGKFIDALGYVLQAEFINNDSSSESTDNT